MFRNCSICSISFHTYISGNLLHSILKANSDFVKVPSHWLTYNNCLYVKVYIPELSQYKMKLFKQGSISEVSNLWIITTWDISVPGASLLNAAEWCYMVKFLLFFLQFPTLDVSVSTLGIVGEQMHEHCTYHD